MDKTPSEFFSIVFILTFPFLCYYVLGSFWKALIAFIVIVSFQVLILIGLMMSVGGPLGTAYVAVYYPTLFMIYLIGIGFVFPLIGLWIIKILFPNTPVDANRAVAQVGGALRKLLKGLQ
jgi:hypothetical protein